MSHQLLTLPRTSDASPLRGTDQARKPARRRQCGRVFPSPRPEVVHIIGVEHATLTPGDVNDDTTDRHTDFVTRPGRYAHQLVIQRTGWSFGE